jgi:hypothetical protein
MEPKEMPNTVSKMSGKWFATMNNFDLKARTFNNDLAVRRDRSTND